MHFGSADFVEGAALGEPRCADFVAGAALGEPRSADFVAGTALGEPRSADFVAGTALGEPPSADFVAGRVFNIHFGRVNAFREIAGARNAVFFNTNGGSELCGTTVAERPRVMLELSLHCN